MVAAVGPRPQNAKGQRTKIDWEEVERFFVYDPSRPCVADVAARFGVSRLVTYRRAMRDDWRRKRDAVEQDVHQRARRRFDEDAVERAVVRLRRVVRLVDAALDEAAVEPSVEALGRVLKLITVEREIIDGLPRQNSRERVLREHVERACTMAGVGGE